MLGGRKEEHCRRCSDVVLQEPEALGHDFEVSKTVPATCTAGGSVTHLCSRCKVVKTETLEPLGHDYFVALDRQASCTLGGRKEERCTRCSDVVLQESEALGHDWQLTSKTEPDCFSIGRNHYSCTRCSNTKSTLLPALGHDYAEAERVLPTCTKNGYVLMKCSRCDSSEKEPLEATGHKPGAWATIRHACICTECKQELRSALAYDLAINHYYGFATELHSTTVNSQTQAEHLLVEQTYYATENHVNPITIRSGLVLQSFYEHRLLTVKKANPLNGKEYMTDAGFQVAFHYNLLSDSVSELTIAKETDFLSEFDDPSLLRLVQRKKANNPYYELCEIVDFSNSVIEISKQTENGYVTLATVGAEAWQSLLKPEDILISAPNSTLFCEAGTYRVLFRFRVAWVLESVSGAIYNEQGEICYPYGFANDQYDYFYVTVSEQTQNVLLPDDPSEEADLFYQLNFSDASESTPFVRSGDRLSIGDRFKLVVDTKLGYWNLHTYYGDKYLTEWTLSIGTYDAKSDSYTVNHSFDLLELTKNSSSATLSPPKNYTTTGSCKITVDYTFFDEVTQTQIPKTDVYYLLIE